MDVAGCGLDAVYEDAFGERLADSQLFPCDYYSSFPVSEHEYEEMMDMESPIDIDMSTLTLSTSLPVKTSSPCLYNAGIQSCMQEMGYNEDIMDSTCTLCNWNYPYIECIDERKDDENEMNRFENDDHRKLMKTIQRIQSFHFQDSHTIFYKKGEPINHQENQDLSRVIPCKKTTSSTGTHNHTERSEFLTWCVSQRRKVFKHMHRRPVSIMLSCGDVNKANEENTLSETPSSCTKPACNEFQLFDAVESETHNSALSKSLTRSSTMDDTSLSAKVGKKQYKKALSNLLHALFDQNEFYYPTIEKVPFLKYFSSVITPE